MTGSDSYAETNQDTTLSLYGAATIAIGQLEGSNNNIWDVENGILNQNQVQVIPTNSAGLIVGSGGGSDAVTYTIGPRGVGVLRTG